MDVDDMPSLDSPESVREVALGAVFDDHEVVLLRNGHQLVHVRRMAIDHHRDQLQRHSSP